DRNARLPSQHLICPCDVGPAGLRIVHRQWAVFDLAAASGQPQDQLREFENGHLVRIADVDRLVELHVHQPPYSFDQVVDVLEASRLAAFAEDRQRLAVQSLIDERRDHTAIVDSISFAIGVEDANDADINPVLAVVGHRHRLGEALSLVVYAAGAYWVDVAPVLFVLRVHQRVAVNFRGRSQNELRALGLRQTQSVVCAQRPDLQRLNRQLQVIYRTGRAGEMEHPIELADHVDVIADIVVDKFKFRVGAMVSDIGQIARHQIIHRHHTMSLGYQAVGHVAAYETGAASNQNAHFLSLLVKTER